MSSKKGLPRKAADGGKKRPPQRPPCGRPSENGPTPRITKKDISYRCMERGLQPEVLNEKKPPNGLLCEGKGRGNRPTAKKGWVNSRTRGARTILGRGWGRKGGQGEKKKKGVSQNPLKGIIQLEKEREVAPKPTRFPSSVREGAKLPLCLSHEKGERRIRRLSFRWGKTIPIIGEGGRSSVPE